MGTFIARDIVLVLQLGNHGNKGKGGFRDTLFRKLACCLSVSRSLLCLMDAKRQVLCPQGANDQLAHHNISAES
jgi:hypothetical protein